MVGVDETELATRWLCSILYEVNCLSIEYIERFRVGFYYLWLLQGKNIMSFDKKKMPRLMGIQERCVSYHLSAQLVQCKLYLFLGFH
jgi:hypothetical protein